MLDECLEGGALIWCQELDPDLKLDWETARLAFLEEYGGDISYQAELDEKFRTMEQQLDQKVSSIATDSNNFSTRWTRNHQFPSRFGGSSNVFCHQFKLNFLPNL